MLNYAGWKKICDVLFVIFAVLFLVTRLVLFPSKYETTSWYDDRGVTMKWRFAKESHSDQSGSRNEPGSPGVAVSGAMLLNAVGQGAEWFMHLVTFCLVFQDHPRDAGLVYGVLQTFLWLLLFQCSSARSPSAACVLGLAHPAYVLQIHLPGQGK